MKNLITIMSLVSLSTSSLLPDCVSLNCDGDHPYLFSDQKLSWFDASDDCNMYGGYLLALNSQYEQNCLLKYGKIANIANWY